MTPVEWTALAGVVTGITGAAVAIFRARVDAKVGISSNEREARREEAEDRRDTLADRDKLLDTVLTRLRDVEKRLEEVERIATKRSDHIDVLEQVIYSLGGTPPPRPEGA